MPPRSGQRVHKWKYEGGRAVAKICSRPDCRRAGELLPATEFPNNSGNRSGRGSECLECHLADHKKKPSKTYRPRRAFTEEDDDFIRAHGAEMSLNAIAQALDRDKMAIRNRKMWLENQPRIEHKHKWKTWTDMELEFLTNNYGLKTNYEIGAHIGRGPGAVQKKADDLRLRLNDLFFTATDVAGIMGVNLRTVRHWIKSGYLHAVQSEAAHAGNYAMWQIEGEVLEQFLKEHPEKYDLAKISSLDNPHWHEIARESKRQNNRKSRAVKWTSHEVRYVLDHWGRVPADEMAAHLGRTRAAVVYKAGELRRLRGHIVRNMRGKGRRDLWERHEILLLVKEYGRGRVRSLAQRLGRTERAVWTKAQRLGLQTPARNHTQRKEAA